MGFRMPHYNAAIGAKSRRAPDLRIYGQANDATIG